MSYALVLAVGFVAGIVSGIVGTGATVILLPVLVIVFGPREAVPIMAIVALMSNFAKITSWWREIDWKAVGAYALGGVPAAALGARTLLVLPENTVEVALGLFFLAMVPGRRWLASRNMTIGLWRAGDRRRRDRLSHRHRRFDRAAQRTDLRGLRPDQRGVHRHRAADSLALYISKALTFRQFGALPVDIVIKGLISGSSVMAGTYLARLIVERLSVAAFQNLLDGVMIVSGLALLWAAFS